MMITGHETAPAVGWNKRSLARLRVQLPRGAEATLGATASPLAALPAAAAYLWKARNRPKNY